MEERERDYECVNLCMEERERDYECVNVCMEESVCGVCLVCITEFSAVSINVSSTLLFFPLKS